MAGCERLRQWLSLFPRKETGDSYISACFSQAYLIILSKQNRSYSLKWSDEWSSEKYMAKYIVYLGSSNKNFSQNSHSSDWTSNPESVGYEAATMVRNSTGSRDSATTSSRQETVLLYSLLGAQNELLRRKNCYHYLKYRPSIQCFRLDFINAALLFA
jgi:hypothetical protein